MFFFSWFKHMTESEEGGPGSTSLITGLYSGTGSTVRVTKLRLAFKSSANLFPDRIQNPGWLAEKPLLQTTSHHEAHFCGFGCIQKHLEKTFVPDIHAALQDTFCWSQQVKTFPIPERQTNGLGSASCILCLVVIMVNNTPAWLHSWVNSPKWQPVGEGALDLMPPTPSARPSHQSDRSDETGDQGNKTTGKTFFSRKRRRMLQAPNLISTRFPRPETDDEYLQIFVRL